MPELLVTVVETRPAADRPGALFEMTTEYYRCAVVPTGRGQRLDGYERELGLRPQWVTLAEALAVCVAGAAAVEPEPWLAREAAVLSWLQSHEPWAVTPGPPLRQPR